MKKLILLIVLLLARAGSSAQETALDHFQKGLLEEEANHNPRGAIQAYQAGLQKIEKERQTGAALLLHLGQAYLQAGQTNEARAQFERLTREYPEHAQLAAQFKSVFPGFNLRNPALSAEAATLRARLTSAKASLALLRAKNNVELRGELPTVKPDEMLRKLLESLSQAEREKVVLGVNLADKHPAMVEAAARVKVLNSQIDARIDQVLAGMELAIQVDESTLDSLLKEGGETKAPEPVKAGTAKATTPPASQPEDEEIAQIRMLLRDSPDLVDVNLMESSISKNRGDLVEFLLKNGFSVNQRSGTGGTPLHFAVLRGRKTIAQTLLDRGAPIEAEDNQGRTPLFHGVRQGYKALAELLLQRGANPLHPDAEGSTPLHASVSQPEILELFIAKGVNLESRDQNGDTPLHRAALSRRKMEVQTLIQRRAGVNLTNRAGLTPMAQMAWQVARNQQAHSKNVSMDIIKDLLEAGTDPNIADRNGATALHLAARGGEVEFAEMLLKKGAKLNAEDSSGHTPLYLALEAAEALMATFLLDKGGTFTMEEQLRPALQSFRDPKLKNLWPGRTAPVGGPGPAASLQIDPELARRYGLFVPGSTGAVRAVRGTAVDIATKITLHGQVLKNTVRLEAGQTWGLSQILDIAGLTYVADRSRVRLQRKESPTQKALDQVYNLSPEFLKTPGAEDPAVQAEDVVTVSQKGVAF